MFVDARQLPDGSVFDCDLCIVGAGAAGITISRELRDSGLRLIVLESGGFDFDKTVQDLYRGKTSPNYDDPLDVCRLRYFGGTTNHWAGYCRPLDEVDFHRRPGFPYNGWPFERDELLPFYRRAFPVCGLGAFDENVSARAAANGGTLFPFVHERLVDGLYHVSAPLRFGQAYREDLAAAGDVAVHLNANVVDIETDDDARHVSALAVGCLSGTSYRVRPRAVVLAAGAIENARILLNADGIQRAGLGNGSDLVGRFFMDHPLVFEVADLVPADDSLDAHVYGQNSDDKGTFRVVTTMPESLIVRERLPNVVITWSLEQGYTSGDYAASRILRALSHGTVPNDFGTNLGRVLSDLDHVALTAFRKAAGIKMPIRAMTAHARIEPVPDPQSRVTLIAERDPLGLRRVRLDWRPNTEGVRALRRILELIALEVGRTGTGRLRIRIPMEGTEWPSQRRPSDHAIGTTRMDDDPARGVVDRDCRVHGVDNLYLAGSSVYPSAGPNNPTLTIVALALRMADRLQQSLSS
jgi:choline dehydrogenase-like flavoprotein